jgi:electron transport complex protein RnfD
MSSESSLSLENNILTVSSSPHIRSKESISKIMWTVNLSLAPAAIFAIYKYGFPAFRTVIAAILAAVITEAVIQKIRKKPVTVSDGSAFLTGLLLAMCLPATLPVYMTVIGSFVAIAIAKHAMGGLGYNLFNPAHVGRAALMVSWPIAMTTWKNNMSVDAVTSATTLNVLKQQGYAKLVEAYGSVSNLHNSLFFGAKNGSIGEVSVILLLLGGIYLIYKGYIYWAVPASMIGTVALLTWVFGPYGYFTGDPLLHISAGGLMIGAFFMATDMVTSPITKRGRILFAVGAGAITVLIRLKGGYPEGVCYSILLMNAVTPLIDRLIQPAKFGKKRQTAVRGGVN